MPVLLTPRPARRGSTRAELTPRPRPLTPHQAGRIMHAAERHPALDVEALATLRVLLFDFGGGRLGGCAYTLAGVFQRVRRAVLVNAAVGWRGAARWCQVATLYLFTPLPEGRDRAHSGSQAAPLITNKIEKKVARAPLPPLSGELEAALARLGAAIAARG